MALSLLKNKKITQQYLAKWHLFETSRELFRKVRTTDEMELHMKVAVDKDRQDETDHKDLPYPPKGVKKNRKYDQVLSPEQKTACCSP